ncbi:hypothetical protein Unana1_03411 [Umbelopsis nana]
MIAVILEILIALLFPPAAVAMLGYLPGHIHAFWIIWRKYEAEERAGYYRGAPGNNYGALERQAPPPPPQQNYQPVPNQNTSAPPPNEQLYDSKPPAYQKN